MRDHSHDPADDDGGGRGMGGGGNTDQHQRQHPSRDAFQVMMQRQRTNRPARITRYLLPAAASKRKGTTAIASASASASAAAFDGGARARPAAPPRATTATPSSSSSSRPAGKRARPSPSGATRFWGRSTSTAGTTPVTAAAAAASTAVAEVGIGGGGGESRFAPCPVCRRSFPATSIRYHVDRCCRRLSAEAEASRTTGEDNATGSPPEGPPPSAAASFRRESEGGGGGAAYGDPAESTTTGTGVDGQSRTLGELAENSNREVTEIAIPAGDEDQARGGSGSGSGDDADDASSPAVSSRSGDGTVTGRRRAQNNAAGGDAFSRMMKRSRVVFRPPLGQVFHVSSNLGVSWTTTPAETGGDDGGTAEVASPPAWSATLMLKSRGGKSAGSQPPREQRRREPTSSSSASARENGPPQPKAEDGGVSEDDTRNVPEHEWGNEEEEEQRDVELVVSTDIPNNGREEDGGSTGRRRLVRSHSRLSVGVLKSMLQKSVRRRRPIPAARVAMELADRAWGDLIRRLPVIAAEDSCIHPDLPLLVWLMVADSKGYDPPFPIVVRVIQIAYEIAACPWRDRPIAAPHDSSGTEDDSAFGIAASPSALTLPGALERALGEESGGGVEDDGDGGDVDGSRAEAAITMVRSLLLRARYGGMACDVAMLLGCSGTWCERFRGGRRVPDGVSKRIRGNDDGVVRVDAGNEGGPSPPGAAGGGTVSPGPVAGGPPPGLNWIDVPCAVHRAARDRSLRLVAPLASQGLGRLTMDDVCLEGVDFHCSAVLDDVLADEGTRLLVHEMMMTAAEGGRGPAGGGGGEASRRLDREGVLGMAKRCMWEHASGVNLKRDLAADVSTEGDASVESAAVQRSCTKSIWEEVLAPKAKAFAERFVRARLSASH